MLCILYFVLQSTGAWWLCVYAHRNYVIIQIMRITTRGNVNSVLCSNLYNWPNILIYLTEVCVCFCCCFFVAFCLQLLTFLYFMHTWNTVTYIKLIPGPKTQSTDVKWYISYNSWAIFPSVDQFSSILTVFTL